MEEVDKGCPMIRMGVRVNVFFLVPAHPGSPGQKAVKRLCVKMGRKFPRRDEYLTIGSVRCLGRQSSASPAMGHWGTCPLDFQQFTFMKAISHVRCVQDFAYHSCYN